MGYLYVDEDGRPIARKVRLEGTDGETGEPVREFRWERPVECGGETKWTAGTGSTLPLYGWPELRAAIDAGQEIGVTEGESDCEALRARGPAATTPPHGANQWRPEWTEQLKGATGPYLRGQGRERERTRSRAGGP
jgi:hypothetical protein